MYLLISIPIFSLTSRELRTYLIDPLRTYSTNLLRTYLIESEKFYVTVVEIKIMEREICR